MPHVATNFTQANRATRAEVRRRIDPVLIAWLFVALMALLPLRAALAQM